MFDHQDINPCTSLQTSHRILQVGEGVSTDTAAVEITLCIHN